jgi:hypothetical protein
MAQMNTPEFKARIERGPRVMLTVMGPVRSMGRSLALWQNWIWYSRSTAYTLKATLDGLLYALLTAGAFGWLWPRA